MLEQPLERGRLYPAAQLKRPYGRGMSLEITVDDVGKLHDAAQAGGASIVLAIEEREYATAGEPVRVRQFAVADLDGYVLRFSQPLATGPG